MKIGEKVSVRPQTFGGKVLEGRVVYIHPKKRFAVVEFEIEQKGPRWLQKPGKIRLRERSGCGKDPAAGKIRLRERSGCGKASF